MKDIQTKKPRKRTKLEKAVGIGALSAGIVGGSLHMSHQNSLFQVYLSKQTQLTDTNIKEAYKFAQNNNPMGNYLPFLYATGIIGGSYLLLKDNKEEQ